MNPCGEWGHGFKGRSDEGPRRFEIQLYHEWSNFYAFRGRIYFEVLNKTSGKREFRACCPSFLGVL
jgi:hypothetical protein